MIYLFLARCIFLSALVLPDFENRVDEVPQPVIYEWDDDFSESEKRKLYVWLEGATNAVFDTLGYYPFSIYIYMHKSSGNEPVPWANTVRGEKQGIHFHVNPDYSLNEFFMDWTATHEISHLSIPYVGRDKMWFSEGYASFMQWFILQHQGYYTLDEVNEKYRAKLEYAISKHQSGKSFLKRSNALKKSHDYPALYWGGATYFFQVNEALKTEYDTNIFAVIKAYQEQDRMQNQSLLEVIQSLDKVSGTNVFSTHFNKYSTQSAEDAVTDTPIP